MTFTELASVGSVGLRDKRSKLRQATLGFERNLLHFVRSPR
jgi:hypothetical protein